MQVKRYIVPTINNAMEKIKKELGPDAVVLSTRRIDDDNNKGLLEVIAARDGGDAGESRSSGLFSVTADGAGRNYRYGKGDDDFLTSELADIRDSLKTLFDIIGVKKSRNISPDMERAYRHLIASGISSRQAARLITEARGRVASEGVSSYADLMSHIGAVMKERYETAYRKAADTRITAFVGPTGAGKTTTLAKLAARFSVEKKKTVGIITTDTYRIGATEQLKIYTNIMDLPLKIATTMRDVSASIAAFSDKDLILVDTPGRSPGDTRFASLLHAMVSGEHRVGTCLVLSTTSDYDNTAYAVRRFAAAGCGSVIFTKIDEAVRVGQMYDVVDGWELPVTYVANGQDVPQDIDTLDGGKFAGLIVGRQANGANN